MTTPTRERHLPPGWSRARRIVYDWWYAAACIALIFGSDYKLRLRDVHDAVGAGIDTEVLLEVALYGIVAVFILYSFPILPKARRVAIQVYLACCFAALIVLSVSYSPYKVYSAVRAVQFCVVILLLLAASQHATRAHFHRFAHAFLLLVCASIFYGIVKPSPPVNARQVGRFTWLAIHPTISGLLTGLAVVVAASYLWSPRTYRPGPRWSRFAYLLVFAIVCAAMLMTKTRGAIGAALLGIVVLWMMRLGARRLIDLTLTLIVGGAAIALGAGHFITKYFERGEATESLTTLNSRTELWGVAWDAFTKQPMFGYGIGSARGIFYTDTGLGGGHNAIVNLGVELGLVGLLTWTLLIVTLIVGTVRLPRTGPGDAGLDRAMISAITAFLLFDGIFYEGAGSVANAGSTWLFVLVAWLTVAQQAAARAHGEVPATST